MFRQVYKSVYELTHPVKYKYDLKLKIPYTYKKFDFRTRDGVKLAGIEYQPKTVCKGTILVCHFLGGSKEAVLMFVDSLIINGYRVLGFDNRNHGESETYKGVKTSSHTDFVAFYKKVKSMGIEGPFGIMGFSMGASLALWAIYKYNDIQAVITDSGPLLFVKKYFNYVLDDKKIKSPFRRAIFLFIFLHYIGFSRMVCLVI
ncbi:MAG: lysophospholipase [Clostridiales bacterium]|nr:lysophospholipase [Clostridiales bacterium]